MALVLQETGSLTDGLGGIPRIDLPRDLDQLEAARIPEALELYGAAVLRVTDPQLVAMMQTFPDIVRAFYALSPRFRRKHATHPDLRVGDRLWGRYRNAPNSVDCNRSVLDEEKVPFPGAHLPEIAPVAAALRNWREFGEWIVHAFTRGANDYYGQVREVDLTGTSAQFNVFDVPTRREIWAARRHTSSPEIARFLKQLNPGKFKLLDTFQGDHGDLNYVTIGMPATQPGLEVAVKDSDKFARIRLQPDELILYGGWPLELMTGHRIKELVHHVANLSCYKVYGGYELFNRISGQVFTVMSADGPLIAPWVETDESRQNPNIVREAVRDAEEAFGLPAGLFSGAVLLG